MPVVSQVLNCRDRGGLTGSVACKHFPGHGATDVDSHLGVPVIRKTRQQLDATELVPFRRAFAANVDAIIVAHIALPDITGEELPSCVSPRIAHDMLRNELGFEGVAVSDCLEMQATLKTLGIARATPMAAKAGCDIMMICHTYERQKEGIEALIEAVKEGSISKEQIAASAARVEKMKDRYLSWDQALANPDAALPPHLVEAHSNLSRISYEASVTVVRDEKNLIPLSGVIQSSDTILLLTPVVKPLNRSIDQSYPVDPFETLGKAIAARHPRVRHAPYTAHGLTPTHETLIRQANAIIIATSNGNRLPYQIAMARHVAKICGHKPLVAIAVCNPYDLASDHTGTPISHFLPYRSRHVHLHV
jgi:beta-N-acetylhexosaminidase